MTNAGGPYELPEGWEWTTLGDIVADVGKVNPKNDNPEKEFVYLDIASIDNSEQKITNPKMYLGGDAPSRARQLVKSGDILFSTVRTYLKNIAMVNEMYDGQIASTGFCVIRPYDSIEKRLVFQLVQMYDFLEPLNQIQRGTSYPAVRDSDVFAQMVPLPPLPEQRRIVARIEELFTQLDAGVSALETARAQLKRYRQSVLKAAVEGRLTEEWRAAHPDVEPASVLLERIEKERRDKWEEEELAKLVAKGKRPKNDRWKQKYKEPQAPETKGLPELPEGWCYTLLEPHLLAKRNGMKTGPFGSLLKKHEHQQSGVPVLGIENIKSMKFVPGSKIHITKEKADQLSDYNAQPGDILISRSGTVGEICVVPDGLGETRISTNLMRVSLIPGSILPHFFCLLFNGSPFVLNQVSELCKGSTRDFLNQHILSSIIFPLPPLAEQHEIVSEIERRLIIADRTEATIAANLKRAARLRQSILKNAFRGDLVSQDPNDEPASLLLERIMAERAKAPPKGRKARPRKKKAAKTTKPTKQTELI